MRTQNPGAALDRLAAIMARLRGEGGCPWDREQTHSSLRPYLIEETYEVLEALERGEMSKLCEELGDLLLQIVFHAQLASERGDFTLTDVITRENEKMVRRHPHVFGRVEVEGVAQVLENWEAIKAQEKGYEERKSLLDGIPPGLPALLHAAKIQGRAAKVGFEWENLQGAVEKVWEEARELRRALKEKRKPAVPTSGDNASAQDTPGAPASVNPPATRAAVEEEFGDLLFALVNVARYLGVNPEMALRGAIHKFTRRFRYIENAAAAQGLSLAEMDLAAMDRLWEEAKKEEI